jgi:NOL1/NOP2/fmu family ribosome biogenesis protein
MLAPGGRLVYSSCTFAPEENEETIFKFLLGNRDFHVVEVSLVGGMEHGRKEWVDIEKCLAQTNGAHESMAVDEVLSEAALSIRLWPGKVRGEGHFLCVLQRDGQAEDAGSRNFVPGGRNVPVKKEVAAAFRSFAKENLNIYVEEDFDERNLLAFGDQLYLAPANMPGMKGLKVMRPGLHLGTIKKDRFEPSHALALSLKADEVKLSADFTSGSDDMRQYLNGQTLRLSGEMAEHLAGKKGWCLMTCDGYSIGWAKLAGGLCKNHYPKGLRINY